jgi:hypothetical protein
MGLYINPTNGMSKEKWLLHVKAEPIEPNELAENYHALRRQNRIPLAWVHNGVFTALGVMIDEHEMRAFIAPNDRRPRLYFVVKLEALEDPASGVGPSEVRYYELRHTRPVTEK